MSEEFDAENFVPQDRTSFSLRELAKRYSCTAAHFYNLARDGEFGDLTAEIGRAPSRALIRVNRAAVVDFVRRRSSHAWHTETKRARMAAKCSADPADCKSVAGSAQSRARGRPEK